MTEKDLEYVISVLKEEKTEYIPDWYSVTGFLLSHRIAGLFYNRAKRSGNQLPKKIEKILCEIFEKQKRKVNFMRDELFIITQKLSENKVPYMLLKGSVLNNLSDDSKKIYEEGERVSNDIDLLVKQDGITVVSNLLQELGFIQGYYDLSKNKIEEFSRIEVIKRRMNRGEIAPFIKMSDKAEFPFVEVDVNYSLGNTPIEGLELLEEMISSSSEYAGKVLMRVPNEELFFLHLITHQYKESCLMFMVKNSKNLDLYKLADIYYLYKANILDKPELERLIEKYGMQQQAGTVLKQVGEIFADEEIQNYVSKFKSNEPIVIDYDKKKAYSWCADIKQRLCNFDEQRCLKELNNYDI